MRATTRSRLQLSLAAPRAPARFAVAALGRIAVVATACACGATAYACGAPAVSPSPASAIPPQLGSVAYAVSSHVVVGDPLEGPRSFLVSVPSDARAPLPVVLVFHGGGMSAGAMRAYADLERRARAPAIFVYPSALVRNVWADEHALHWDGVRDLAFVDALLADLARALQVDRAHIHAFGLSSGAYFVNELACARPSLLASIVAVEGGGPFGDCAKASRVSAMIVHDADDPVVPAAEGRASLAHWVAADACDVAVASPGALVEGLGDGNKCTVHTSCAKGLGVAACRATGGLHGIASGVRENALAFMGLAAAAAR